MEKSNFLSDFAKILNDDNFNIKEINQNNILRNRLFFFLNTMGYGYASLGILRRLVSSDRERFYEIAEILVDCNIIRGTKVIDNTMEESLYYNKNLGLSKCYKIKYSNEISDLGVLLWEEKALFSCSNNGESLNINIKIPMNTNIDYKEEVIALVCGKRIRRYNFNIIEEKSIDREVLDKLSLSKRATKVRRKLEFGAFPLYDLIVLEKEFLKNPFITTEILGFLKTLYFKGYYSNESIKVIKILNKTLDSDMDNENIILIEAREEIFDLKFIKRIHYLYLKEKSDKLDFIINKIINKEFEFYEPFLESVYCFYKKNNDINALLTYIELCERNNINIYKYGFRNDDKLKLNIYVNTLKKLGYRVKLNNKF